MNERIEKQSLSRFSFDIRTHTGCGRHIAFMVRVLTSGWSCAGLSPCREHCVVFMGKTLYSHSTPLHPDVQICGYQHHIHICILVASCYRNQRFALVWWATCLVFRRNLQYLHIEAIIMQLIGRFFIFYYVYYCYFLSKVMNKVIKKYFAIFFCRQKIPSFWILWKSFLTFFSICW